MSSRLSMLVFGAINLIIASSASPIATRTVVNCNDFSTGLDPLCWAKLNLTNWINNWWTSTGHNSLPTNILVPSSTVLSSAVPSSPWPDDTGFDIASPSPNPFASPVTINGKRAAACLNGETWSTCYLRTEGQPGQDCSTINPGAQNTTCMAPKAAPGSQNAPLLYVAYNIYAINQYFTDFYTALSSVAESPIANILTSAARYNTTTGNSLFTSANQHLSADVPLIQILQNHVMANSSQLAPGASSFLHLVEARVSNVTYGVDTDLKILTGFLQARINSSLALVMDDLPTFVEFADKGAFCTSDLANVTSLVSAIEDGEDTSATEENLGG